MTDQYSNIRNRGVRPVKINPTFPIDESEVRKLRRASIMRSPKLILLSLLGTVFTKRQVKANEIRTLFDRVSLLWRDHYEDLTVQVIRQMIDESNASQNSAIAEMIEELIERGHKEYAITLGKFLILKQNIEHELHMDRVVDKRKEELEVLVDNICQEVCHEIYRASAIESTLADCLTSGNSTELNDRSEQLKSLHERIRSAYQTLKQTSDQVPILLKPGQQAKASDEVDYLDDLLRKLQRENSLAKNIDDRLRTELPRIDRE